MKTREQLFEEKCWEQVASSDLNRVVTIGGRVLSGTETVTPRGVYFAADITAILYFAPWRKSDIQQTPRFREVPWSAWLTRKQAIIVHFLSIA
ncbi:MAG: hypothetical protein A4E67_02217 [Syntrophaceae bacterium PtaB.Bin038]|nr:MAG: hypothetical protein A4E67_02217 [Syntrophaceae bacterium PtaB.Bin038]